MDQPLSQVDREYLVMMGNLHLIERLDDLFPPATATVAEVHDEPALSPLEQRWVDGGGADSFKLPELQELARARGLSDAGTKAELVVRIEQYDTAQ
jgi:hypothetical protein